MKPSAQEQDSITAMLTRIYMELVDIEQEHRLFVGEGDFRPRIEYFHDAVRAFSAHDDSARATGGRLSVEMLAYDVECLRYIQSLPAAPFKPDGQPLAAGAELINVGKGQDLAAGPRRIDRTTRERISELYQHYSVLFAALLKPYADADYIDRTEELNHDVQDLNAIIDQVTALAEGKGSINTAMAAAAQMEDDKLHRLMMAYLQEKRFKSGPDTLKLTTALKSEIQKKNNQIKTIEQAHMNYALAQLGIYETSKDMLKTMAQKGMNLVGKFVEASIADTKRSMGR
jgi:hypothetical protein